VKDIIQTSWWHT